MAYDPLFNSDNISEVVIDLLVGGLAAVVQFRVILGILVAFGLGVALWYKATHMGKRG